MNRLGRGDIKVYTGEDFVCDVTSHFIKGEDTLIVAKLEELIRIKNIIDLIS